MKEKAMNDKIENQEGVTPTIPSEFQVISIAPIELFSTHNLMSSKEMLNTSDLLGERLGPVNQSDELLYAPALEAAFEKFSKEKFTVYPLKGEISIDSKLLPNLKLQNIEAFVTISSSNGSSCVVIIIAKLIPKNTETSLPEIGKNLREVGHHMNEILSCSSHKGRGQDIQSNFECIAEVICCLRKAAEEDRKDDFPKLINIDHAFSYFSIPVNSVVSGESIVVGSSEDKKEIELLHRKLVSVLLSPKGRKYYDRMEENEWILDDVVGELESVVYYNRYSLCHLYRDKSETNKRWLERDRILAMQIAIRSLSNRYSQLTKLMEAILRDKTDIVIQKTDDIYFEISTTLEDILDTISPRASDIDMETLEKLCHSSPLDLEKTRFINRRNALLNWDKWRDTQGEKSNAKAFNLLLLLMTIFTVSEVFLVFNNFNLESIPRVIVFSGIFIFGLILMLIVTRVNFIANWIRWNFRKKQKNKFGRE